VVPGANGKIAFTSDRDGNGEVYVMNAGGSGQTRLTNNPSFDGEAAWSPDGSKIAFASGRDGNGEVYVMSADGSGQTTLTNHLASEFSPDWQTSGSNETTVTATVESAIQISATSRVDFGPIAVGATKLGTPNPASVLVSTNGGGYALSVARTEFSGGDIPLSLAVTAPGGAGSALTGQTAIPTTGSLTVGSRSSTPPVTGDEWSPVYQLGPVPLRPAGATSAIVTYTAVAT
jgi:hypothetical protein